MSKLPKVTRYEIGETMPKGFQVWRNIFTNNSFITRVGGNVTMMDARGYRLDSAADFEALLEYAATLPSNNDLEPCDWGKAEVLVHSGGGRADVDNKGNGNFYIEGVFILPKDASLLGFSPYRRKEPLIKASIQFTRAQVEELPGWLREQLEPALKAKEFEYAA